VPRTSYKDVTPRAARSRRVLALTLAVVQFLCTAFASAQAIVADGRTQTAVNAAGKVVSVTTGTASGANAFNSFSKFSGEQGITANLFLPGGTANLINMVRDRRTDIYGVLNAIRDGRIGGNVWFANPYGFVVEAGGVVDVGSLSVVTPTERFVDRKIRLIS
jgi:filamentous hemagglutinin family protein